MASKAYHQRSLGKIMRNYYDSPDRVHFRLGQWFVNHYIAGAWGDLFYTEDDAKAVAMIAQWLTDNSRVNRMPKEIS